MKLGEFSQIHSLWRVILVKFSMLDEILWTLQKYIEKHIFKETFWQPASENTCFGAIYRSRALLGLWGKRGLKIKKKITFKDAL